MTHELIEALRSCPAARHPALLRAAIEAPDERAPRLALASALRAEGDSWADLIALQLEWDSLGDAARDRRRDLLARQSAILRAHPPLFAAVAGTSSTRGAMKMRGGLVEAAEIPAAAWLESAAEIYELAPLRDLEPFPMSAGEAERLCAAPELSRVRSLRLSTRELGDKGLSGFLTCPSLAELRTLDLYDVGLTDETVFALAATSVFRSLEALHLSNCKLSAQAIAALGESPRTRGLRTLRLEGHWIDDAVVSAIAKSSAIEELRDLALIGGRVTTSLRELARGIEVLTLTGSAQDPEATCAFVSGLASARNIFISGTALGDAAALARGKPHLETLALRAAGLSAKGIAALTATGAPSSLAWLDLTDNAIGDEGAIALSRAPFAPTLTRLTLEGCGLGEAGATALVRGMPRLVKLDLSDNPIGDEGARAIAGSPSMAQIAFLGLSGCRIGPTGARALLDSPYLSRARIVSSRSMGPEIEKELRARRAVADPLMDV